MTLLLQGEISSAWLVVCFTGARASADATWTPADGKPEPLIRQKDNSRWLLPMRQRTTRKPIRKKCATRYPQSITDMAGRGARPAVLYFAGTGIKPYCLKLDSRNTNADVMLYCLYREYMTCVLDFIEHDSS